MFWGCKELIRQVSVFHLGVLSYITKKIFCFIIVWALFISLLSAKEKESFFDSLKVQLSVLKEDTNKVKVLNKLSKEYFWKDRNDSALIYANSALLLADNLSYKNGVRVAYYNIGSAYISLCKYSDALKNLAISLKIAEEMGEKKYECPCHLSIAKAHYFQGNYIDALKSYSVALSLYSDLSWKEGIVTCLDGMGLVYSALGNSPEALKRHFASLKISEETGNKSGIAVSYTNIGNVYCDEGNKTEGLKYYLRSLKIRQEINEKWEIASNYNNIGLVYSDLGRFEDALKCYYAALKLNAEVGNKQWLAYNYTNIGQVYSRQGNNAEALKKYLTALKISEEIEDKFSITNCYNNISDANINLGRVAESKKYLYQALSTGINIGAKDLVKETYKMLAVADSVLGNFRNAFDAHKKYVLYRDSLFNEENITKLAQTRMQYDFDKKQLADSIRNTEAQLLFRERLHKQKTYTWIGISFVGLLLIFSLFIYTSKKKLSAEKQRSEDLLHNILPEEVSKELKIKGTTSAKEFDNVTVLFTDFVGFTKTSERMSPQNLVNELHNCFKAFDEIIGKYNIEKIKTIGDAYLAVCGLPNAYDDHASKIVGAALEIRDFMLARKAQLGDDTFEIRIGIHSGPVVAGIVGIKKFAYDIWGDTVNTAARMEQNSERGKITASEVTYRLIKNSFECEYRGEIEAKNKGALKMYFILSAI
jgi:class 3 adenylate cyclase/tetratricopeptide (TPR) repeat protein